MMLVSGSWNGQLWSIINLLQEISASACFCKLVVVQLEGENFISDVARYQGKIVDSKYIELEITESLFSKDPECT